MEELAGSAMDRQMDRGKSGCTCVTTKAIRAVGEERAGPRETAVNGDDRVFQGGSGSVVGVPGQDKSRERSGKTGAS